MEEGSEVEEAGTWCKGETEGGRRTETKKNKKGEEGKDGAGEKLG